MTRFTVLPHRLFDRPWRSGHPFCPRLGRLRRVVMLLLLLIFTLIIGGYNYLTDSDRVREKVQSYLSDVICGKVEVRSATLSIFEGLRVDGVNVYVDPEGGKAPDSLIFSAQSFILKYDPRTLLAGQIEASQIIAQKPHVYLTENRDHPGEWNFHRLGAARARRAKPSVDNGEAAPIPMPELLLRNARVDIGEFNGQSIRTVGSVSIDGQLTPVGEGNRYRFEMQAHGAEGIGPYAGGTIALNTQEFHAQLHNVDFMRDLRSMFPAEPRAFCERLGLSGLIDVPELSYSPPRPGQKASFRVEVALRGVTLHVPPEYWISQQEIRQLNEKRPASDPALQPSPITLTQGGGRFIFTEAGVLVKDLSGRVENNDITVNGHIDGYGPDAPAALVIASPKGKDIFIPPNPPWQDSLPKFVRDIYQDIQPTGTCRLLLHIDRPAAGAAPVVSGQVDIVNGAFCYRHFAYPVREASGTIAFGPEPQRGGDFVKIINFRGRGMKGGPNENMWVIANGEIGPLSAEHSDPQVKVVVTGNNLSSEPALAAAYPPEIADALSIFDSEKRGQFPQYHGSFALTLVHTAAGRWTFDTDVNLDDASGRLVGFPYPLDHVRAEKLRVRDGYVDIDHAYLRRPDGAEMDISGRVVWGEGRLRIRKLAVAPVLSRFARQAVAEPPEKVDLMVRVKNVPIDQNLVNAIPAEHRYWIKKLGIGGTMDCDGRVLLGLADGQAMTGPARLVFPELHARPFSWHPEEINFDLDMGLRNGTFWPADGTFSVSDVGGRMHLSRDGMEVKELHGKRDNSTLTADGAVRWGDGQPDIHIHAAAKNLPLDASLYAMLPEDGRRAWDEVQPRGAMDVDVNWRGAADRHPDGAANAVADASAAAPTTQSSGFSGFHAVLKPTAISCTIRSLPYRLDGITAKAITIDHDRVTLDDVVAHHDAATITASGTGDLAGPRPVWDLKLGGRDVLVDQEFRDSVPATMQALIDSLKLRGKIDFDFHRLVYRGEGPAFGAPAGPADAVASAQFASSANIVPPAAGKAASPTKSSASTPAPGPDLDLSSTVTLHDGTLDAGVPMSKVDGRFNMDALIRDGKLFKLDGKLDFARFVMAGREVSGFHATLTKPRGTADLNLDNMQADVAGGKLGGQLHMVIPDEGASKYTLNLLLRNADVKELAGDAEKDLKGELTANVSLEGAWGQNAMRRGRGDVNVSGRELYRMPLILGLVQVTNLSLPIGSPFKQGLIRYSIEGQRVNFERIELKSDSMMMSGSGHLDFGTKQVRMTFTTDNPNGFKIPFINDIWQGARQELFKISIKGSIQQPKFEANPFGTVTTTIDEVFKGDAPRK
jgi:hypothetical protein